MTRAGRAAASGLEFIAAAAGAAALAACAASAPSGKQAPTRGPVGQMAPAPGYDWHVLMVMPFGTLLKDVPFALGEVLVFHDSAEAAGRREDRECYRLRGTVPPRFFARPVDEYALCFENDRLNRVEASVSLPGESAAAQFAAACAEWQQAGAAGVAAPDRCAGRSGATDFDARLTPAAPAVSIVLIDATPPVDPPRE